MSDDRILAKLAKLLELADRGDEHEAQVAAQRAAELMAKHQIDAAQVVASRGVDEVPALDRGRIDAEDGDPSRVESWHKRLLVAVAEAVGGRPWMHGRGRRQQFMVVGPAGSVGAARYMYLHLERQIARLSRAATRERGESNAWRRAYAIGMCVRVHERLKEGRRAAFVGASSTALVVVDRTRAAVDAEHDALNLRQARYGAQKRPDAGVYGYKDGSDVDLGATDARRIGEGSKKLTKGDS